MVLAASCQQVLFESAHLQNSSAKQVTCFHGVPCVDMKGNLELPGAKEQGPEAQFARETAAFDVKVLRDQSMQYHHLSPREDTAGTTVRASRSKSAPSDHRVPCWSWKHLTWNMNGDLL